jgi:hypothetical protein
MQGKAGNPAAKNLNRGRRSINDDDGYYWHGGNIPPSPLPTPAPSKRPAAPRTPKSSRKKTASGESRLDSCAW